MYSASSSQGENNGSFQRQGSIRKVIPADPAKSNLYDRQNEDVDKLYKMYRQEYVILAEYKMVQYENIRGIYVIPSKENSLVWFGVVFIRNGFYEDGVFRFSIFLNEGFPDAGHPKIIFQTEVFHPVIDSNTKELYLFKAFPKWNKTDQHLWQVLKYIQWIFYNIEGSVQHAVNKEAVQLFKNDLNSFKIKVAETVKSSLHHLYDAPPTEDPHYITFEPYIPEVHDKVRVKMLDNGEEKPNKIGLSWVLAGSCKSLTRPPTPPLENES